MIQRTLRIDPRDAVPIWRQVEAGIRRLVACGALPPGAAVPSIRDLAHEHRVNPATIAKGYQQLVAAGVLEVRRGDGTYVCESPPPLERRALERELREGALRLASLAITLGASRKQALDELAAAWDSLAAKPKRRHEP